MMKILCCINSKWTCRNKVWWLCGHLGEARRTGPRAPARWSRRRASRLWLWCTADWPGSSLAPPTWTPWQREKRKHGVHFKQLWMSNTRDSPCGRPGESHICGLLAGAPSWPPSSPRPSWLSGWPATGSCTQTQICKKEVMVTIKM